MKQWIDPCKILLEQYRNAQVWHNPKKCPLCIETERLSKLSKATFSCKKYCIWYRMTGMGCCEYIEEGFKDRAFEYRETIVSGTKEFTVHSLASLYPLKFMETEEWRQFRIQQLHSWINQLEYWR